MSQSNSSDKQFLGQLWVHYDGYARRDLPWRQEAYVIDPYAVLVSELMLQQTQVQRVVPKYLAFLAAFPSADDLAAAPLADVLRLWQGLGYNRRAKYLWQAAKMIVDLGSFPSVQKDLEQLPGVGPNTAGAIRAYAFNQPAVFVETNIRTVLLHHYFAGQDVVDDTQMRTVLEQLVSGQPSPREFYWALMDYGTNLKAQGNGQLARAKAHVKQSKFEGSQRQVRGSVIRALSSGSKSDHFLHEHIHDDRLGSVLKQLQDEGLISLRGKGVYQLAGD